QRVDLAARGTAGVSAAEQMRLGRLLGYMPLDSPGVAARDQELGFLQRHVLHAHEEEIVLEHSIGFTGEPADVHGHRFQKTKRVGFLRNNQALGAAGREAGHRGERRSESNEAMGSKSIIHPVKRFVLKLNSMVKVRSVSLMKSGKAGNPSALTLSRARCTD